MALITKKALVDTYLLTIPRNHERAASMKKAFPQEIFTVLNGVDGQKWSFSRPKEEVDFPWEEKTQSGDRNFAVSDKAVISREINSWMPGEKQYLESTRILSPAANLSPGQVACALTHREAWWKFLEAGDREWALFLEDDMIPGKSLDCPIWEWICRQFDGQKRDHLFLCDELINADAEGNITGMGGTTAYALSRKGATAALSATRPLFTSLDNQWYGVLYGIGESRPQGGQPYSPDKVELLPPAVVKGAVALNPYYLKRSSIWNNDKQ